MSLLLNILFGLAEICLLTGYLSRDILVLRCLVLTGNIIYFSSAVFVAGYSEAGMATIILFSGMSSVANCYNIAIIATSRYPIFIPDNLKSIYNLTFSNIAVRDFYKKIFLAANIIKIKKGDVLAIEGEMLNELILIMAGKVDIKKHGVNIASLEKGDFVGEMSFIAGGNATADAAAATEEVTCLAWKRDSLRKLSENHPTLYSQFQHSIAVNVIKKLASSSSI